MRITVTEEHIQKGEPTAARCCPVALAIKDATGRRGSLGLRAIYVYSGGGEWETFEPPTTVALFRDAFDAGEPVQPFSFDLPLDESAAHPQVDESH